MPQPVDPAALLLALVRAFGSAEPGAAVAKLTAVLHAHGIDGPDSLPDSIRGAVAGLLTMAMQRAEEREELLRARERAEMLSEASFEGIMIHVDGVVIDANQRLADMLGYERHELMGPETIQRCVAPDDLPGVLKRIGERWEGEYVITGVRKDDTRFRAELLTKQGRLGARPVRVAAVRDVTERERTHVLLRESESRLRELARTAFDLLVYSRDGVIVEVVGPAEPITGHDAAALVGRSILELATPDQRDTVRAQLEAGKSGAYRATVAHASGEAVPIEVVAVESTLQGEPARLAGLRDLREAQRVEAERREVERQHQQTQRLDSLGVLAGGIAHDFNNLLVGIVGGAELLAAGELGPDDRASVQAILECADRAATLTAQLLAYAGRRELGQREPLELGELVGELRALLLPTLAANANFTTAVSKDCTLLGSRSALLHVLVNLVTNAFDALGGEPGTVALRAQRLRQPGERFRHALGSLAPGGAGAPWVLIEVTDTGVGMDAATQARVFEPFFSTKAKGHGLGLAACHGIVSAHGGAIHVESRPGQGSTFSVLLPAAEVADAPIPAPSSRPRPARILAVDDEPIVRRQLRRMLETQGYSVLEAPNGRSGLELLEREVVDLVLLDVTMPDFDGTEVVREARRRGSRVPIVLISGYADFPLEERLPRESYSGFLAKPFRLDELLTTVRRVLNS